MPGSITFPELPSWVFTVDERSAGVFEVMALHESGRSIGLVGFDPDELIAQARAEAAAPAQGADPTLPDGISDR